MTHGSIIRQLRLTRGLSQASLAAGISDRTTLNAFELHGARASFETICGYLDRMNITLEEYQALHNNEFSDEKNVARTKFHTLVTSKQLTTMDQQVLKDWRRKYERTQDYFYYALYAQVHLIRAYRYAHRQLPDAQATAMQHSLQNHLNRVETWGRFELVILSNCLFAFDSSFIRNAYKTALEKMLNYESNGYFPSIFKSSATMITNS